MIYARHNGVRVVDMIDHMARPLNRDQYLDALGIDAMMLEATTLEEIIATHLFDLPGRGETVFTDAIVTTRNRIDRTMASFIRALNSSLKGSDITANTALIGEPRRAGDLAVIAAELPLSDGQSIFVIFHSPSNDPSKITASDTLVAFRFLLNKRDVTHVVAPSKGRDISLKQTTLSLANLAERNSAKFAAKVADSKAKNEELATLDADTEQQLIEADQLTQKADTLSESRGVTDAEISQVSTQLTRQQERNEELRKILEGLQQTQGKQVPELPPEATSKQNVTPPVDHAEKMGLITPQTLPAKGSTIGQLTVVKASARAIDVDNGKGSQRYTWDGTGYKRRDAYLATDGSTTDAVTARMKISVAQDAPEDGLRYVKQKLQLDGTFTLTNGAVIAYKTKDVNGELTGLVVITEKDGEQYSIEAESPQGGAMGEAASKLYTAYRDGKAHKYWVEKESDEEREAREKAELRGLLTTALEPFMGSYGEGFKAQMFDMGADGDGDPGEPAIALDTPVLPDDREHDGYYIKANVGTDNKPNGTVRVLYGDGGPITGGTEVTSKDEAKEIILREYQKDFDEALEKNPAKTPELAVESSASTVNWYGLRIRPFAPANIPEGHTDYIAPEDVQSDPRVSVLIRDRDERDWRYGMVGYDSVLTTESVDHYSLTDMSATSWNEGTRSEALTRLYELVDQMVQGDESAESIWQLLFKPKGDLIKNNPFMVDGKYQANQLTTALQEAGYTGSVRAMVNAFIDKAVSQHKPETELPGNQDNQWDEADPAILAILEKLEALRTNEKDYTVYLETMGGLIEQLEKVGAVEKHEPYLHKVADRLTELMEEAA